MRDLLLGVLLCAGAGVAGVAAASAEPPELLRPATAQAQDTAAARAPGQRQTTVELDRDALATLPEQGPAELRLTLFPDVSYTAVLERRVTRTPSRYSWHGHLVERPEAWVHLVVQDEAVDLSVDLGAHLYRLHSLGRDLYRVIEGAPTSSLGCATEHPDPGSGLHADDLAAPSAVPPTVQSAGLPSATAAGTIPVTLLAFYTNVAKTVAGGTAAIQAAIQGQVDLANLTHANSGTGVELILKAMREVVYDDRGISYTKDKTRFRVDGDGFMDGVYDALVEVGGADLTTLFVSETFDDKEGSLLGLATGYGSESVVYWDSPFVLAHETGHNFDLCHEIEADPPPPDCAYRRGFVVRLAFIPVAVTMMAAGSSSGLISPRLMQYSDPGQSRTFFNPIPPFLPFSLPLGDVESADAVRRIKELAPSMSEKWPSPSTRSMSYVDASRRSFWFLSTSYGDELQPFWTLPSALDATQPDGEIVLRPGTYTATVLEKPMRLVNLESEGKDPGPVLIVAP